MKIFKVMKITSLIKKYRRLSHKFKRKILFPIETTSRELDSRILLGVKAARKDDLIIIADQQLIRSLSFILKDGVFFGKHLFGKPNFSDTDYYKRLKKNNFRIVYLSEEGGIWPGREDFWIQTMKRMENPSLFDKDDIYCAWGRWQFDYTHNNYNLECKAIITGTPRFEILNEKYKKYHLHKKNIIKAKYEKFILINTSFSAANGIRGEFGWFSDNFGYSASDVGSRSRWFGKYSQQMIAVAKIVELINKLSIEFPNYKIVVRPHPSERKEFYENVFNRIPNVHIEYSGSAIDWINASEILIQSGCTTGLEAVLMGKKVINFKVTNDSRSNVHIPEQCGMTISNVDDVINIIKNDYDNPSLKSLPTDEESTKLIHNLINNDCIELIDQAINEKRYEFIKNSNFQIVPGFVTNIIHRFYLATKFLYFYVSGQLHRFHDYRNRFDKFERQDVVRKIAIASEIYEKDIEILNITPFSISFKVL
jgi:surface carbohydrate biosynthesis protein